MEVRQIIGTIPVVGTPLTILTIHFATVLRAWDPGVVIVEVPIRLLAGRRVVHQALILAATHREENNSIGPPAQTQKEYHKTQTSFLPCLQKIFAQTAVLMKPKRCLSIFMTVEEELIRHVVHNDLVTSLFVTTAT